MTPTQSVYKKPICVLCGSAAVTTALHIPVCKKHFREYEEEAKQYLPDHRRKFYYRLVENIGPGFKKPR